MKTLLSLLIGLVTGTLAGKFIQTWCLFELEGAGGVLPAYATPRTRKLAYEEGYEACRKETIEKVFDKDIKIIND